MKTCVVCGSEVISAAPRQITCSPACSHERKLHMKRMSRRRCEQAGYVRDRSGEAVHGWRLRRKVGTIIGKMRDLADELDGVNDRLAAECRRAAGTIADLVAKPNKQ